MKPQYLIILGLIIDIVGVFFLSAEVIKLKNLKRFNNQILRPLHQKTLSPKIDWEKGIVLATKKYLKIFHALHYLAGVILLVIINYALDGKLYEWFIFGANWLLSQSWYWIILGVIIFAIYGIWGALWMMGELVHMSITFTSKKSINLLSFIIQRTPDGTVGLIGFGILTLGLLIQILGTYLTIS